MYYKHWGMHNVNLSQTELTLLLARALEAHRVSADNAQSVAQALAQAQCDGQIGHGVSRIVSYCKQALSGKVDGYAIPKILTQTPAALRIDAAHGFAFPAIDFAISELASRASVMGISCATISQSHHFGVAGWHVERLANKGLVAIIVGNSPAAIAPHGGNLPLFGTNPIAFAAPRKDDSPIVIDLSLSKVARGKVMVAAKEGRTIPEGWGLDAMGQPSTDPHAVLEGSMLPMGDAKGAALVMMVEILAAALSGSNFGFEASSFFDAAGEPPGVGQTLLCFEPNMLSGNMFAQRLEGLIHAILAQPHTRLPGSRRIDMRSAAEKDGVSISPVLYDELLVLLAD
jgi:(2R)-3-sulfolactate dehydrogenase (NADP+)